MELLSATRGLLVGGFLLACLGACSASGSTDSDRPTGGKTDAIDRLCEDEGEPAGCDICEIRGWIADGTCDEFCLSPDPDCASTTRPANPACHEDLDEFMFECIEDNLGTDTLDDVIDYCVNGVVDGEPIEIAGICDSNADTCFATLADNAQECADAIGDELVPPQRSPNPACHEDLDEFMFECIEDNLGTDTLDDVIDYCVSGVVDGEPIEIAGICDSNADTCFATLADNAQECADAIGDEL